MSISNERLAELIGLVSKYDDFFAALVELQERRSLEAASAEPVAQVIEASDALPWRKVAWLCKDVPVGTSLYAVPPARPQSQGYEDHVLTTDQTLHDICGFCGLPGADKLPHPARWPGEQDAGTRLVHTECEVAECQRAQALLSDYEQRRYRNAIRWLRGLRVSD